MGWNTTVVVLNDALHNIEKDRDFGKNLAAAIQRTVGTDRPIDVPAGNHCNAATVVETHHADFPVLVRVGGNMGKVVEDASEEIQRKHEQALTRAERAEKEIETLRKLLKGTLESLQFAHRELTERGDIPPEDEEILQSRIEAIRAVSQ